MKIQKIERQKIKPIPGKVGTPSKIKHQHVKQITGKTPVRAKKLPDIDVDGIQPDKGMPSMGQSSKMKKIK